MTELSKLSIFKQLLEKGPIILLFVATLNEFDFNYLGLKYFSFNFPFILIYYWSLKRPGSLGYGLIFLSGLFNDAVSWTSDWSELIKLFIYLRFFILFKKYYFKAKHNE